MYGFALVLRHRGQKQSACSSAINETCGKFSHQQLWSLCAAPQVNTTSQREQIFSSGEFTIAQTSSHCDAQAGPRHNSRTAKPILEVSDVEQIVGAAEERERHTFGNASFIAREEIGFRVTGKS